MILPKKWGQGQLFAFSALDGASYASDDFVGMLCGDHIGIRFFSKVKRELALVPVTGRNLEFDAVTSDYICCHFPEQKAMRILYLDQHLIVGNVTGAVWPGVFTEGPCQTEIMDGIEIQDTMDGDLTAIGRSGERFAFAFGHTKETVISLVRNGLEADFELAEKRKQEFYEGLAVREDFAYAQLYAKCASVMKSQLYSPEADFDTIWSTPDRLPHQHLWLWDSVFHALGHRNLDQKLAEDLIRAVFIHQREDGFVPHFADVQETSAIIQPPIIAWGVWQLYETSGDLTFLRECYEHNKRFLQWCHENRRQSEKELYTWKTTGDTHCRCDECGMDNSPRFDTRDPLFAIDFSCFMANDVHYMNLAAKELGLDADAVYYEQWFERIAADVNAWLWCEEDGFYFDYNIVKQELHKVWSVASFLPLFAGICDARKAESLVHHLQDPESFATPFPIPSVSKKDPTFGSDMWRGPVWINYNYMIAQGLVRYGYERFGEEIIEKTIAYMDHWYQLTGTIYEFYDCNHQVAPCHLNRKGLPFEPYNINVRLQSIRDYGWSCTLLFDLLSKRL